METTPDFLNTVNVNSETVDPSSLSFKSREVSLVIQNPSENLVTCMVQQLVTAKVDFKVVQGSS